MGRDALDPVDVIGQLSAIGLFRYRKATQHRAGRHRHLIAIASEGNTGRRGLTQVDTAPFLARVGHLLCGISRFLRRLREQGAAGDVPKPERAIPRHRDKRTSIGREGHAVDPSRVPAQARKDGKRCHI
jgi:hypothetical protein